MERRAWDLEISGSGERTAVESEVRLYDIQAQTGRWLLRRRDDPVDHFLLVVADTRANRRVIAEFGDLLVGLPPLRTDMGLKLLDAGCQPPMSLRLVAGR